MKLPRLSGFAELRTRALQHEIAQTLGQALGISFDPYVYEGHKEDMQEFEGDLTSRWFVFGLYLLAEQPDRLGERSITLSLNMDLRIIQHQLGLSDDVWLYPVKICHFLAAIVRRESKLPFAALPPSSYWYGGVIVTPLPTYAIPQLSGSWEFRTKLSLAEIALQLNQKTQVTLQASYNQALYTAVGFGHRIELRESSNTANNDSVLSRTVILSIQPNNTLSDLGLNPAEHQIMDVPMTDYMRIYLQQIMNVSFALDNKPD